MTKILNGGQNVINQTTKTLPFTATISQIRTLTKTSRNHSLTEILSTSIRPPLGATQVTLSEQRFLTVSSSQVPSNWEWLSIKDLTAFDHLNVIFINILEIRISRNYYSLTHNSKILFLELYI